MENFKLIWYNKNIMKKVVISLIVFLFFVVSSSPSLSGGYVTAEEHEDETRTVNNIIVKVNFDDSPDYLDNAGDDINYIYSGADLSVKNYFTAQSDGKLSMESHIEAEVTVNENMSYFLPEYYYKGGQYVSTGYTDGFNNKYYLNGVETSPETSGAKKHADEIIREQLLIREIIEDLGKVGFNYNIDTDNDGCLDSISFVLGGNVQKITDTHPEYITDSLLWPHMSSFYTLDYSSLEDYYYAEDGYYDNLPKLTDCILNGKTLQNYCMIEYRYIHTESGEYYFSRPCHELMHVLGCSDYYSYTDSDYDSVGSLDIMAANKEPAQLSLGYIRQKMEWLEDGTNIIAPETSGSYTLFPTSGTNEIKSLKIVLNDYYDKGEYFMIEARSGGGSGFDGGLTGSGLIVYRINEENAHIFSDEKKFAGEYGNMYGADEVYVFRYCKTGIFNNNQTERKLIDENGVNWALIDGSLFKKSFGTNTEGDLNNISYSDGTNSGIIISGVNKNTDGSYTFNITVPDESTEALGIKEGFPNSKTDGYGYNYVEWDASSRSGYVYIAVTSSDYSAITKDEISGATESSAVVKRYKVPLSFRRSKISEQDGNYVYVYFDNGNEQSEIFSLKVENLKIDFFSQLKLIVITAVILIGLIISAVIIHSAENKKKKNKGDYYGQS